MYFRSWKPKKDKKKLTELTVKNFHVSPDTVDDILHKSHKVLVIYNDKGKIVGYLCYNLYLYKVAHINYVVLDQKYRGKGILQSLLPELVAYARKQGILVVSGFVNKKNPQALQKFKDFGFIPILNYHDDILIQSLI
ncbi:GNAT family N-acetyltransferase [Peribacillus muralis]|uniref:GNAT family N-acetyltransferase n=1 Tax=Peribacillus muralis TaxID=264697 RepID=UPI001F4EB674|nr:GNAT family N-acetyltransferase [Peribacillus muralis]MCK1993951.1 GNAT family N-acetyltransferase [Peribacillus muralis]MCK2014506.1 GNAT family N-acetyltransferase [Peribacillus muralis]